MVCNVPQLHILRAYFTYISHIIFHHDIQTYKYHILLIEAHAVLLTIIDN